MNDGVERKKPPANWLNFRGFLSSLLNVWRGHSQKDIRKYCKNYYYYQEYRVIF